MLVTAKTDTDKCGAAVIRQIHTKREGAHGVIETAAIRYWETRSISHGRGRTCPTILSMSRATGEVAPS
jgi:hypothetical protein